jgi:DNA-binding NarL/FixJ family response regulator
MHPGHPMGLEMASPAHRALAAWVAVQAGLLRHRIVTALQREGVIPDAEAGEADVTVLGRALKKSDGIGDMKTAIASLGPAPVVIVSPPVSGAGVRRCLRAGVRGIVFEPELELALVPTLRAVAGGQTCIPGDVKMALEKPTLSHREREVLKLAVLGRTNSQIAAALCLAESTVKTHLSAAFNRLGVCSRREAATLVLDPDEGLGPIILGTTTPAPGPGGALIRS